MANELIEGEIEIQGEKFRTRVFPDGAFKGQRAIEVPVGPMGADGNRALEWVEEKAGRKRLAILDFELRMCLDVVLGSIAEKYGFDRLEAANVIRMIVMEPSSEAILAPVTPPRPKG